ncbi:hypothetical protein FGO68_gene14514 [Halteria grandinella]|uniref:Chromatin assembly factor 1 subunit A dimerization domain-containing protein n=1 Tax=Halteria grandinella TaxID=5974 RepID=A0A8J8TA55_HALGN|nr:hypothetical protein FGO68_gene14514 [Halteria grandinella]
MRTTQCRAGKSKSRKSTATTRKQKDPKQSQASKMTEEDKLDEELNKSIAQKGQLLTRASRAATRAQLISSQQSGMKESGEESKAAGKTKRGGNSSGRGKKQSQVSVTEITEEQFKLSEHPQTNKHQKLSEDNVHSQGNQIVNKKDPSLGSGEDKSHISRQRLRMQEDGSSSENAQQKRKKSGTKGVSAQKESKEESKSSAKKPKTTPGSMKAKFSVIAGISAKSVEDHHSVERQDGEEGSVQKKKSSTFKGAMVKINSGSVSESKQAPLIVGGTLDYMVHTAANQEVIITDTPVRENEDELEVNLQPHAVEDPITIQTEIADNLIPMESVEIEENPQISAYESLPELYVASLQPDHYESKPSDTVTISEQNEVFQEAQSHYIQFDSPQQQNFSNEHQVALHETQIIPDENLKQSMKPTSSKKPRSKPGSSTSSRLRKVIVESPIEAILPHTNEIMQADTVKMADEQQLISPEMPDIIPINNFQVSDEGELARYSKKSRQSAQDIITSKQYSLNEDLPMPVIPEKKGGKPRRTELIEPQKLSEEQIRAKYAENEEYQEWTRRLPRLKLDLERSLKRGLPKIFQTEEEMAEILFDHQRFAKIRDLINEQYVEFKTSNIEPSGEDPASIDFLSFFENLEVKRAFVKLIIFTIEGSSLTMKELKKTCYEQLINDNFPEFSTYMTDLDVEELITSHALRRSYGVKLKNPSIYSDSTPAALWCWEIQDFSLFEPIPSKTQLTKARTQRAIIGKKVQALLSQIELCQEHTTFDSTEKIYRLNLEFQNYNTLTQRETQWNLIKRKREEVEGLDSAAHSKNQLKANVVQKKPIIKYNDEMSHEIDACEVLTIQERSEVIEPSAQPQLPVPAQVQNEPIRGQKNLDSFFIKKAGGKDQGNENPSTLILKSREDLIKNPYIRYAESCETEAMKIKKAISKMPEIFSWPTTFSSKSILDKFKQLKDMELQAQQIQVPSEVHDQLLFQLSDSAKRRRPKHIYIHDSGMQYQGSKFDKSSRIINCRRPFQMDPTIINYDQDSDEEWEDLYGDNLEDDELLLEEDMEVEEDEMDKLNMPNAGVSNSIKQKLAFRTQYCFATKQYKEDDPDLKKEGFIVDDTYFSQDSDIIEGEEEEKSYDAARKDLLIKQMERNEQRLRQGQTQKPYVLLSTRVDLGDYKAVSFRKKVKKVVHPSRMSFGNVSTTDEFLPEFPISVAKMKKVEPIKLEIKDVIDRLIEIGHGSSIPKKQLVDLIKSENTLLKKGHVETFVKECFKKEKRPLDSKVRLIAQAEAVERYGGQSELIQNMPTILEKRVEEDRQAAAVLQAQNPQTASKQQNGLETGEAGQVSHSTKQTKQSRQSKVGTASRQQSSSSRQDQRLSQPPPVINEDHQAQSVSNLAQKSSQGGADEPVSSVNAESLEGPVVSSINEEGALAGTTAATKNDEDHEMQHAPDELQHGVSNEENSWINVQQPVSGNNGNMIETPAFNNKAYSLGEQEDYHQAEEDLGHNPAEFAPHHFEGHNHSQSFLDDQQISLSQHAIVSYNEGEEQKLVEIRDVTYQRSNQQYQSTPIHNFRTLRSREISVNHSQNTLEGDLVMQSRDRSDSVETDKGNPNQDKVLSNLESHLQNEGGQELNGSENIIVLPNNSSFESPRRNTSMPFEESKVENQDLITPLVDTTFMPLPNYDYDQDINPFNEQQATSKKRIARNATAGRSASASRQREENPRRSKRLESRHRALQMMQDGGVERQASYVDPEDELNRAQSSQQFINENNN